MTWVDADRRTVAGLVRDATVLAAVLDAAGHRLVRAPRRWLCPGDEVIVGVRVLPGVRVPVRVVVRAVGPAAVVVAARGLVLTTRLVPDGTGTAIRDEVSGRAGLLARLAPGLVDARTRGLVAAAEVLDGRPVVVATALVRDGAVLAAQRTRPPELAGRWELPGGRVEPAEAEADAVVRECREELGCAVTPTGRVGTDLLIDAGVLRVHAAVPAAGPEPTALEHAALRWVRPAELDAVDWIDADRAVLPDLRALLMARPAATG
ncbi:MAG TPA: NUDIX domain-containing protein [Pseudonocardia sp.]|nr:NUDIX domain-containing protein [Pseudonocardia sp.]